MGMMGSGKEKETGGWKKYKENEEPVIKEKGTEKVESLRNSKQPPKPKLFPCMACTLNPAP